MKYDAEKELNKQLKDVENDGENKRQFVEDNFKSKLAKSQNNNHIKKVISKLKSMWQLLGDPSAGWGSKALVIAALAYFIMPLDAIPDIAPLLGFMDDAGVIALAAAKLASDLKRYEDTE